jgi:hypothetical protein
MEAGIHNCTETNARSFLKHKSVKCNAGFHDLFSNCSQNGQRNSFEEMVKWSDGSTFYGGRGLTYLFRPSDLRI